jgi:hypothetical protein
LRPFPEEVLRAAGAVEVYRESKDLLANLEEIISFKRPI